MGKGADQSKNKIYSKKWLAQGVYGARQRRSGVVMLGCVVVSWAGYLHDPSLVGRLSLLQMTLTSWPAVGGIKGENGTHISSALMNAREVGPMRSRLHWRTHHSKTQPTGFLVVKAEEF